MGTAKASRSGVVLGLAAFGMWGLLPLYWRLLDDTDVVELLAHRMAWSMPTALLLLLLVRNWSWIGPLLRQPKRLAMVLLSAALITANWAVFIWCVAQDRVLEASLGYFINPLLTIAVGVLVLRERLRPAQWVAVGLGVLAVLVMSVAYGQVPWLSLSLSVSFAAYGLVKKKTALDGLEGFTADTAFQFLPALAVLLVVGARGEGSFTAEGPGHALLLVLSGLATALPLIFFGAATVRLPLSTVGLMQYIAPSTMFLLGLFVFHEEMPPERWLGFGLVWGALSVLTWDVLRQAGRRQRTVASHVPATAETPSSRAV
ncbi:EamA family transporter RarD [Streptomyces sp. DSM 44915]|uniref:EamA family transporter RarD n=1 Tax=Streptomyces chisholmiae TaxID=3075540 RepID=A0ABU2JRL8_9ACTN|nr:EamA family transporter RarD [Streptomyces sp. DSM 44915]MDT0267615.1 EamA family transporter RarD [Streptomyces sp. DSM 44915]